MAQPRVFLHQIAKARDIVFMHHHLDGADAANAAKSAGKAIDEADAQPLMLEARKEEVPFMWGHADGDGLHPGARGLSIVQVRQ